MRKALLDPRQHYTRTGEAGEWLYVPRSTNLNSMLVWTTSVYEIENLCWHHRLVEGAVATEQSSVDKVGDALASDLEKAGWEEAEMLALGRRGEAYMMLENILHSSRAFNDEMTVVMLWTIFERSIRQLLALAEPDRRDTANHGIRWDVTLRRLRAVGVELSSLPQYHVLDECRLVVNAIKHAGVITKQLALLPAFSARAGQSLREVGFDLQRYVLAAQAVINGAIDAVNLPEGYGRDNASF